MSGRLFSHRKELWPALKPEKTNKNRKTCEREVFPPYVCFPLQVKHFLQGTRRKLTRTRKQPTCLTNCLNNPYCDQVVHDLVLLLRLCSEARNSLKPKLKPKHISQTALCGFIERDTHTEIGENEREEKEREAERGGQMEKGRERQRANMVN